MTVLDYPEELGGICFDEYAGEHDLELVGEGEGVEVYICKRCGAELFEDGD